MDDRDVQRNRIALQQKTSSGLNLSNVKAHRVTSNSVSNPQLKAKPPAVAPGVTSNNIKREQQNPPTVAREGAEHQTQTQTQNHSQAQPRPQGTKREYGSPEWIQGMTAMLSKSKFYFDNIEAHTATKLSKTLVVYGATIAMFFSNDVTHIITTNPIPSKDSLARSKANSDKNQAQAQTPLATPPTPMVPGKFPLKPSALPLAPSAENNILVKAMGFGIKIWNLNRMVSLLAPVLFEPMTPNENLNLQDYLHRDKVYGLTTTQNDDSPRADYYVFKNYYMLVEDTTGHYQTVLAYEYPKKPSSLGRHHWPRFRIQSTHRSPFLWFDEHGGRAKTLQETANNNKAEEAARDDKGEQENTLEATKKADTPRPQPVSQLASGIVNSVTSHAVSTNSVVGKAQTLHGMQNQDRVLEQLGKRVLNATKGEAGVTPTHPPEIKKTEFVRPADVFKSNRTFASCESVPSKKLPLAVADLNAANQQLAPFPTPRPPTPVPQRMMAPAEKKRMEATPTTEATEVDVPPVAIMPRVYLKKGYCENCRDFYKDLNEHIATPEHRRYAHDTSKFEQLDQLLVLLQRKPKIHSNGSGGSSTPNKSELEQQLPSEKGTADQEAPIAIKDVKAAIAIVENQSNTASMADVGVVDRQQDLEEVHGAIADEVDDAELRKVDVEVEIAQVEAEVVKVEDDDLSSEMSRLDMSETGEGEEFPTNLGDDASPSMAQSYAISAADFTQGSDSRLVRGLSRSNFYINSEFQSPFTDKTFASETNLTSQVETDVTQPDDKFLDGLIADSEATDPPMPIHLSLNLTSMVSDGVEPSMPTPLENYVFSGEVEAEGEGEGSSEADKDTYDNVALLKSPGAGRGAFARTQGANLRRCTGLPGVTLPTPPISRELLKRKFERILEEERMSGKMHPMDDVASYSPSTPQPTIYDRNLQARLLSQSPQQSQHQKHKRTLLPSFTGNSNPVYHPMQPTSSALSPPVQFEPKLVHSPAPTHAQVQSPRYTPMASSNAPFAPSRTPVYQSVGSERQYQQQYQQQQPHSHHGMGASPGGVQHGSSPGYPITPPAHSREFHRSSIIDSSYLYSNLRTSFTPQTAHRSLDPPFQYQQPQYHASEDASFVDNSDGGFGSPMVMASPVAPGSTSPTDPISHDPRSALDSTYSSPTASPSRRTMYNQHYYYQPPQQFAVMSHAEQELERCYHHYRGNQLPVPAGAKKLKSSSSLEEEFEEYGEGCMVFLE
ncbi:hypothetical protein BGZ58_005307 [Dissophora ornata]|nr:hypothetical protein BGZ58_005307 [Dissophora ornata]